MQVPSFIPAAPPSSAPGASQGRQERSRDQGFDAIYEERAAQPSGRDRTRDDDATRRKNDAGDAEGPERIEEQRPGGTDRKGAGGEDVSARETDTGGDAEPPDIGAVEESEVTEEADVAAPDEPVDESEVAEGADVARPDEPVVVLAEAPARQTRARTPDGIEQPRVPRVAGEATLQVRAAKEDMPAASTASDRSAPDPVAPGRAAQTAEAVPAHAAVRSAKTEEVQIRPIRAERSEAAADAAEPRIDARPRDTEVRLPKAPPVAVGPEALTRPAVDSMAHLAADPGLSEVGLTETRTTAEHVARAEAMIRHDTPRPVMQQVAEAARALRDGPVELTLQPEELGKVRMTLTAGADGNMAMSLQAERSETLDLLRRHIGELARELQDLGFSNLSFSFGQDRAGAGQHQHDGRPNGEGGERPVAAVPLTGPGLAARPNLAPATGGLDLRL